MAGRAPEPFEIHRRYGRPGRSLHPGPRLSPTIRGCGSASSRPISARASPLTHWQRCAGAFPNTRFVWLMGADNLAQIHHWRNWRKIMNLVPVAVLDRSPYSHRALASTAARHFAGSRIPARQAAKLVDAVPPAWSFSPPATPPGIGNGHPRPGAQPFPDPGEVDDATPDEGGAPHFKIDHTAHAM